MKITIDDGGREAAGYKGGAGDCVVRAIAIATEQSYQTVYDALFEMNRASRSRHNRAGKISPRDGNTTTKAIRAYMDRLGWTWTPTMAIGSGCKVHLRGGELPAGRLIVSVSRHLVAVIDGVIHDTYDPSRGGQRCVYGYWSRDNA